MTTAQTSTVGELARKMFEAVNAHDVSGLRRFWDADSVDDFVVLGPIRGADALAAFFSELFTAIPDITLEVERILTCDGDTSIVQYRAQGTFDGGAFQGIAATDRPVDFRGVDIIRWTEAGTVDHNDVYYDGATFARQIGMLPPQGSAADQAVTRAFNVVTALRRALKRT